MTQILKRRRKGDVIGFIYKQEKKITYKNRFYDDIQ